MSRRRQWASLFLASMPVAAAAADARPGKSFTFAGSLEADSTSALPVVLEPNLPSG
jgi:hypothetical protein